MQFSPTATRVPRHTADSVNVDIEDRTVRRLTYYALHPELIEPRLRELEREWDVERSLALNMSILASAGIALGAFVDRRWLMLPGAVLGFYIQHTLQGWCPPLPVMRRAGIRTSREIEDERHALLALQTELLDQDEARQRLPSDEPESLFDER